MAVVQLPAGAVWIRRNWTPPARNQTNRSAWTGGRKTVRLPGAGMWRVSAAVKPFATEAESWRWKAFEAALEGDGNSFLMPRGCQNPPVSEAYVLADGPAGQFRLSQGSTSGYIYGLPANSLSLRGGQAVTFALPQSGRQMVVLTQDLVANADGVATITFRGALRAKPLNNAAVELANPVCEMTMNADSFGLNENEGMYAPTFDATEAF